MPLSLTYPGVYVEELPSGARTITGVSTSVTAFIGRCLKGPVNTPTIINSFADFERMFGGLWLNSKLGYAVRDFYLNGGSQALIVRAYKSGSKAKITVPGITAGQEIVLEAVNPGEIGNQLQVEVTHGDVTTEFTLKIKDLATGFVENYNNIDIADLDNALNSSSLMRVASNDIATDSRPQATGSTPLVVVEVDKVFDKAGIVLNTSDTNQKIKLEAADEGAWANGLVVAIDHNVPNEIYANYGFDLPDEEDASTFKIFNLTIKQGSGETAKTLESFVNLTVEESPRRLDKVLQNESNLLRVKGSLVNLIPVKTTGVTVNTIANDGAVLDAAAILGSEFNRTGLYALEKADIFNLLCIPPYDEGDIASAVITSAAAYCEKRRAFFIIDGQKNWKLPSNVKAALNMLGTKSQNAAVFFPYIQSPNPLRNNQMETFAPCGAVAGTIARIDSQRGIWKAPAGIEATLAGVSGLAVSLTDAENGEINPLGVNCLRVLPAAGSVIWGARTLKGNDQLASEWKYIPVRRLALYIEESLYRGMQWAVFEPNDEPLWRQITLNVDGFMNRLFRQGAFQGGTAKDAYFVKCNKETTTQDDIDNGIVNVMVGFAPLKPAEFVVIKLQQIAGQTQA